MQTAALNGTRLAGLLIALGALFGIETYLGYFVLYKFWPLLITVLGAGFIGIFYKREKREEIYLGIGIYLICLSVLSLYCNFSSWDKMAALWPLFINFIGLAFLGTHFLSGRHRLHLFLGAIFISISIVFFLVFAVNYKFWWTIFIFLGLTIFAIERKQ